MQVGPLATAVQFVACTSNTRLSAAAPVLVQTHELLLQQRSMAYEDAACARIVPQPSHMLIDLTHINPVWTTQLQARLLCSSSPRA